MTNQKHWYHATTRENWAKIKKEGLRAGSYLSRSVQEIDILSKCEILLSVKYAIGGNDSYFAPVGELVVGAPIPPTNLKVAKYL